MKNTKKGKNYVWHRYTNNMFLGKTSKAWSFFNNKRLNLTVKHVKRHLKKGNVLDIGSYDGFVIYSLLKKRALNNATEINFLDLYNDKKSGVLEIIENNKKVFKKEYPKIKFNIIKKTAEEIKEKEKYDNVFIFETLEHVEDEEKVINNINNSLKKKGRLFITYPVEFGVLFFFKDLGRRFILRKQYHSLKELLYGLFGVTKKIERAPRGHKGYDYRNTVKIAESKGFNIIKNKYYPINNKYLAYGGSIILEKN